jgi:Mrp family chromosome partitioning ATPase/uncharacterized protein involved in exopolysaccharide biosynthesis
MTCLSFALIPRRYSDTVNIAIDRPASRQLSPGLSAMLDQRIAKLVDDIRTPSALAATVVADPQIVAIANDRRPLSTTPSVNHDARSRAFYAIRRNLQISYSRPSAILAVQFSSSNDLSASRIANELADRVVNFLRYGELQSAREIRARSETLRTELIQAEAALDRVHIEGSDSNAPGSTSNTSSPLVKQLAAVEAQQTAAEAAADSAQATTGADGVPTSPVLRDLAAQIQQASALQAELASRYGPRHPEMILAEQQLTALNARYAQEAKRVADLLLDTTRLTKRTDTLRAAIARDQERSVADSQNSLRTDHLRLAVATARERYGSSLRHYKEISAFQPIAAHIIAYSEPSTGSASPNILSFILAGGALAVFAAISTLVVREAREKGLRSERDVVRKLDLPLVAMIPDLGAEHGAGSPTGLATRPVDYLIHNPNSDFAAAFRNILAGLGISDTVRAPQSIAICSAFASEGKTTVSTCLARAAALAGLRVVLVDCDGRRREASKSLAPSFDAGLVQLLKGDVSLEQALTRDAPSGAWIIAHSSEEKIEPDPFSAKKAMASLISELLGRFDLVILDTAPVLALTEARVLAGLADGVLLIVRWRKTPAAAIRAARDLLGQAHANIKAVSLTLVEFA